MPNEVIRDPANKQEAWRIMWDGDILPPSWNSKGAIDTITYNLTREEIAAKLEDARRLVNCFELALEIKNNET